MKRRIGFESDNDVIIDDELSIMRLETDFDFFLELLNFFLVTNSPNNRLAQFILRKGVLLISRKLSATAASHGVFPQHKLHSHCCVRRRQHQCDQHPAPSPKQ